MRASQFVLAAAAFATSAAIASPSPQFPYEAVVQSDGVIVRSGPGERYDPTMKLSAGQRITVHRHDPGGWFTISPPPGSFSWINAGYVEITSPGRGVVKAPPQADGTSPRVPVWVGSEFSSEHKSFQRQLATDDEVIILGEEPKPTDMGVMKFYKIQPPRQEYRWVKGDFVQPLSAAGSIATQPSPKPVPFDAAAAAKDPFAGPSFVAKHTGSPPGFPVQRETTLLERELNRAVDKSAVVKSGPDAAQLDQARRQLAELDDQLRAMLAQGPGQWQLDDMEQSYRALQSSSSPGIAGMIDARIETIASRRPIKAEYEAFVAITSRTDQRDAELLSLQRGSLVSMPVTSSAVQLGLPQPLESAGGIPGAPQGNVPPQGPPGPVTLNQPPTAPADVDITQLDGAGIISRVPMPRPGLPLHVLVAPDGRLLAYLHADGGVNLDAYLGRSMGVVGRRIHEERLRSDVIIVQKLTPVQLQP
ncbi:MAG: hypothetical protein KF861_02705 [Planctomycetaceae bacterium]|nr:hypothetical protein [Planctomycetaceae bacterium]